MAILIVTREFPPQGGGIGVLSYSIAKTLAQMGKKVVVLCWDHPDAKDDHAFKVMRIHQAKRRFQQIFDLFVALTRIVKRVEIEEIYVMSWNFQGVAVRLLNWFRAVPYINFVHGYDVAPLALSKSDLGLMGFALSKTQRVLANSCFTLALLLKAQPRLQNAVHVPLGVDTEFYHPEANASLVKVRHELEGRKVLLTVARLFERKGHDKVLEALPSVIKQVPNLTYLIVGTGEQEVKLKQMTKSLGLDPYVVFAGFVPDEELPAYYCACDLFVLPNREIVNAEDVWAGDFEGFGLVFAEANACGKPVIAGRSGGASDAIVDGKTGVLVDPMDVAGLSKTILNFLTDESKAKNMGKAGRKRAQEELAWPVLVKRYEACFGSH